MDAVPELDLPTPRRLITELPLAGDPRSMLSVRATAIASSKEDSALSARSRAAFRRLFIVEISLE